jgi:hypothetical protein
MEVILYRTKVTKRVDNTKRLTSYRSKHGRDSLQRGDNTAVTYHLLHQQEDVTAPTFPSTS